VNKTKRLKEEPEPESPRPDGILLAVYVSEDRLILRGAVQYHL
jgi:hypothetical protein